MKRVSDIVAAAMGLLVLAPIFAVVAVLIKLDSAGPVLFKQQRMGRAFRPFLIYKFRTMIQDAQQQGSAVTIGEDPRITRIGWFLRKTKIDELPQLINVLKGDMALVGPRPEVPHYVELFRKDYEEILKIRPGITDLASLKYRDEAAILAQSDHPEEEYVSRVLPEKIQLAKDYMNQSSFLFDVALIFKTVLKLLEFRNTLVKGSMHG
jgi:lipopolysaccharide/colanic/teichoic acid biosynthesis glycosyltransferase